MLQEDPRRTHVPADPRVIAALYEGTNQPLVQPTGRAAQAAQVVVLACVTPAGYDVLVALTLTQTGENVLYAGPPVAEAQLGQAVEEALNFAESMGFMLDASGWHALSAAQKAEALARLPAFRAREVPVQVKVERAAVQDPLLAVARLFAAFAALACSLAVGACGGMSAEQRTQAAEIHYQLGDNLLHEGDAQQALKEYLDSLELEETPEARLGVGLIYAFSLGRMPDGEREMKRALELRPDFSEAQTNLGALYLARSRFPEAVALLEKASVDPLYKGRVLAQSNLGWALYKSGQADKGIGQIRGALAVAPKYCLGWRQLGTIYAEEGKLEQAGASFARYAESCPDVPDAHLQAGKVLARQSKAAEARAEFGLCAAAKNEKDRSVASECARFLQQLGTP